jgi:Flp pilus assembly pilin Flp
MDRPIYRRKCGVDVTLRESFWEDERGQDLVEYSLLLAFVCLAGAAFFIGLGSNTRTLWSIVNNRLAAANQSS